MGMENVIQKRKELGQEVYYNIEDDDNQDVYAENKTKHNSNINVVDRHQQNMHPNHPLKDSEENNSRRQKKKHKWHEHKRHPHKHKVSRNKLAKNIKRVSRNERVERRHS